jgi:hypothetical protein
MSGCSAASATSSTSPGPRASASSRLRSSEPVPSVPLAFQTLNFALLSQEMGVPDNQTGLIWTCANAGLA